MIGNEQDHGRPCSGSAVRRPTEFRGSVLTEPCVCGHDGPMSAAYYVCGDGALSCELVRVD